jgi:phosphoenolpyruvate carboxylase
MDETLRREVRFLTTRLGAIVEEQCGPKVFTAIENLRRLSKLIRRDPAPQLLEANDRQINRLSFEQALEVAHAFSLFFHLVNLCEERQRVRRLRAYEDDGTGAPMSLRRTFNELRHNRVSHAALARLLPSLRIEPVLTAHPTEAKRRSVINHILRIGRTLDALGGELGGAAESELDPWIEALWLTQEVRERPMTPQTEIESTLVYIERTIYDLGGSFWEKFCEQLAGLDGRLPAPSPFLRFGSWVGADRDGNPNVTPQTSLKAAASLRRSVLGYYAQVCRRLLGIVSFACPRSSLERKMRRDLARDMRRFPATRAFEQVDQPSELYRHKLRVMIWRLERTEQGAPGAYEGAREFARDVEKLEKLLAQHPSPRVSRRGPGRLRAAVEIFGFHAASLDFRQHASVTRGAVDELLAAAQSPRGAGGLGGEPEARRIASIQHLLTRPLAEPRLSASTRRALDEFSALKKIQTTCGEAAAHRYVLSMTSKCSDVWDVLLLGRQAGLVDLGRGRRAVLRFDVIPLFETYDDLGACPAILEQLLSDPLYRSLLRSRDNFQEVMLGYSDSVKDSGYVAANFALFRAQKSLGEVAERHGVRLGLFHGVGGTIDRGGGQSYRSVRAQPYAAPGGRIRITEQGEVISLKYSDPTIAQRNLEQLVSSVLDAHLLHPKRVARDLLAHWERRAQELAASSRRFYRQLVYETPEFPQYFFQATPIDLIERLRLGSRPSRRFRSDDLRDLRAIPWVFAWTQSRHFLPSWYGLGYALEQFVKEHAPHGLELLRQMYQGWPFFAVLIDNAEVSLAKTDLDIAGRYAALVRPSSLGEQIFGRIQEEYRRAVKGVLEICGRAQLLGRQPVLAESIRLRNPYVDPLNYVQIRFLRRWRDTRRPPPELLQLLQVTVAGIAFGMKSTG